LSITILLRLTIFGFLPFPSGRSLIFGSDDIRQAVSDHVRTHPNRTQYSLPLSAFDRGDRDAPSTHDLRPRQKTIIDWIHREMIYGIAFLESIVTCDSE
jgi:hypothetical protein